MAKPKPPEEMADINVTPMVDIMLVLLIIFMVVTPMLTKGVSVDMVKTRHPIAMQDADKDDAILIAVTREGRVFLGTKLISVEELEKKVKDLLANRVERVAYVRADARARYQRVMEVVDALRAAGVDQLGLLTEQLRERRGGASSGEQTATEATG